MTYLSIISSVLLQYAHYGALVRLFPVTSADENAPIYAALGSSALAASTTCGRDILTSSAWNSGWDRGADTRAIFTRSTALNHPTVYTCITQLWKIPRYKPITAQCYLIHAYRLNLHVAFNFSCYFSSVFPSFPSPSFSFR